VRVCKVFVGLAQNSAVCILKEEKKQLLNENETDCVSDL
jgi:hypothetical protein